MVMRGSQAALLVAVLGWLAGCPQKNSADNGSSSSGGGSSGTASASSFVAGSSQPAQSSSAVSAGGSSSSSSSSVRSSSSASAASSTSSAGGPAWRNGVARWQWVEIPNTSLSDVAVLNPQDSMMEHPAGRVDAWNGLAANRDTSRLYLAAAGGHADWSGNEVYEIDLSTDAPGWSMLRGPSLNPVIGADYCGDGRPSSTHLYYALTFVRSNHRIFKLSAGSVWGSGNESNSNVDGFDLTTNDWDPAGTWPSGMPHGGAIGRPYAHDPITDDSYTFFSGQFRKWTSATGAWSQLAERPAYANDDIVSESPSAVDTQRNQVLFTRNAYRVDMNQGLLLTTGGTLTDVTFTGADAPMAVGVQSGMHYLAPEGVYLLKNETAGDVYRIDPVTFAVSRQATTGPTPPDAVNGVYTRWQWLPGLGGYAYLPRHSGNVWFLAVQ